MTVVYTLDGFRYVWNGSLTVNVWGLDRLGEWVNFDAFTLDEPEDRDDLEATVVRRHEYALDADPRYTLELPTRSDLMFGPA